LADDIPIRVAKIDFNEVEPLLLELIFSQPEHKELKKKYQSIKERRDSILEKMFDEKSPGKFISQEFTKDLGTDMAIEHKVENLVKGRLICIIKELFADKYQLIINDQFSNTILYTKLEMPDVTANVKQYLLETKTPKIQ
jgi:hypothetical protein